MLYYYDTREREKREIYRIIQAYKVIIGISHTNFQKVYIIQVE